MTLTTEDWIAVLFISSWIAGAGAGLIAMLLDTLASMTTDSAPDRENAGE